MLILHDGGAAEPHATIAGWRFAVVSDYRRRYVKNGGIGARVGAIVGRVAGEGSGAAIGAAAGGAGAVLATNGRKAQIAPGTVMTVLMQEPLTVPLPVIQFHDVCADDTADGVDEVAHLANDQPPGLAVCDTGREGRVDVVSALPLRFDRSLARLMSKQQGEAPAGSRRCTWVKNVWGCRKARWIC